MPRGRPRKHSRNVTGLMHQNLEASQVVNFVPVHQNAVADNEEPAPSGSLDPEPDETDDEQIWDEMRAKRGAEELTESVEEVEVGNGSDPELTAEADQSDDDVDLEQEIDEFDADECWEQDELQEKLLDMAVGAGDDLRDEDWLPYELPKKRRQKQVNSHTDVVGLNIEFTQDGLQHI